jgi:hypothetical protein
LTGGTGYQGSQFTWFVGTMTSNPGIPGLISKSNVIESLGPNSNSIFAITQ